MDKDKQELSYEDCDIGRLVNTDARGFKVAVITGYSRTGKVQLCKWSHNSHTWSLPQHHLAWKLFAINYATLSPRHRSVLKKAHQNILDNGNAIDLGAKAGGRCPMIPHHEGKLVRDSAGNVHFSRAKEGAR